MRKYLIIIIGILFVFSCDKDNTEKEVVYANDNALLADKVQVDNRIAFENEDNPDWIKGFDNEKFVETVFSKIFSGELAGFSNMENNGYTIEEVKDRMGEKPFTLVFNEETNQTDTVFTKKEIELSEIKELYFEEEWFFDKDKLSFEKTINLWTFIRVYYRDTDFKKEDTRYKKIFQIKKNDKSKFVNKIAEDYTYIFKFFQDYQNKTAGLDKNNFFRFLLQSIEEGKIKSYDPIYLVDKSKREFTVDELKNYAGISLDYDEFSDEVNKIIFVEDWFFDEETFSIAKKVKGIGFIADRYNDAWEEKILFFIFFE